MRALAVIFNIKKPRQVVRFGFAAWAQRRARRESV